VSVYALWNNKGGVGKSYLTFQIASEYARTAGEAAIEELSAHRPARTISGYVADRILSPYLDPHSGANFLTQVHRYNRKVPNNLFLVCGDEELEIQASQVRMACTAGPDDAWRIVHTWIRNLIEAVYTEMAMSASDRLIVPFSADGSSKRAVKSVLSLVYGIQRRPGQLQSEFYRNAMQHRMSLPLIYAYVGNRLTQMNNSSASAFKNVVSEIFNEIYTVWQNQPNLFCPHPTGALAPTTKRGFKQMFEKEINDANTASVVSGALGIPICRLTAGQKSFVGRTVTVNQSQLDKQQPNIRDFVSTIE